jgi:hypothetical protein
MSPFQNLNQFNPPRSTQVYLAGPPLVKMATGETTDHETLGGAEMHSKVSGVSDYLAEDEAHAIQLCREVIATLKFKKHTELPPAHLLPKIEPPLYDPEDLLGIVSPDLRKPFVIFYRSRSCRFSLRLTVLGLLYSDMMLARSSVVLWMAVECPNLSPCMDRRSSQVGLTFTASLWAFSRTTDPFLQIVPIRQLNLLSYVIAVESLFCSSTTQPALWSVQRLNRRVSSRRDPE